jgi:hypothetical protein
MEVLRSYVVRVYRQESDGIAGVVESVETGDSASFRSATELWNTLSRPVPARRPSPLNSADQEEGK